MCSLGPALENLRRGEGDGIVELGPNSRMTYSLQVLLQIAEGGNLIRIDYISNMWC